MDEFRRFIRIEANGLFEKNREVLKVISIGNRVKQSGKWKRKVIIRSIERIEFVAGYNFYESKKFVFCGSAFEILFRVHA